MSMVEVTAEGYRVTKGCQNPVASFSKSKWTFTRTSMFYEYFCESSHCNQPLQLDTMETNSTEGDGEVEDTDGEGTDNGIYKNLSFNYASIHAISPMIYHF